MALTVLVHEDEHATPWLELRHVGTAAQVLIFEWNKRGKSRLLEVEDPRAPCGDYSPLRGRDRRFENRSTSARVAHAR